MPAVNVRVRWPDGQESNVYSPSTSIYKHLEEGTSYALDEFLLRAENGIARGRMVNGTMLEPRAIVTRARAAKALYFMWVLAQPPKAENDHY